MQETVINRLSAYLDGELSDSERDTLEQQLAENETLRHELAKLRAARDCPELFRQTPRRESKTQGATRRLR